MKRRGVLLGCAIFLLIAAIFVGRFLVRADRLSSQKRSMADMLTMATGAEAYASEHAGAFPETHSSEEFWRLISPKYVSSPLLRDSWQNEFRYICWREKESSPGNDHYAVISAGADRKFEHDDPRLYTKTIIDDAERDLVYVDGRWVQTPFGD